jgi:hypothetical protein
MGRIFLDLEIGRDDILTLTVIAVGDPDPPVFKKSLTRQCGADAVKMLASVARWEKGRNTG